MKKISLLALLLCFLYSYSPTESFAASFETNSVFQGHYKGGKGSSHKGGKYKNKSTGNKYKKRKK